MALIGKIRNNFWFVLLVLGLALAAFVIMDMVGASNRAGLGAKQIIGEVAGQEIGYQDFQKAEQALFAGSTDGYSGKAGAWNYLVENGIIQSQAEELGLHVSSDELQDLQFGANLSPVIRNTFTNRQTGQLDMQQLLNIKQTLESDQELDRNFENNWAQIQKQIKKTAKQDKLNALVSKSIFTPSFVAETAGKNSSTTAGFEYVKVPFDYINDADVEVSDSDITKYLNENAYLYTNDEESRVLNYAVFNVEPTQADLDALKNELTVLMSEFEKTETDSIFAISNEGVYNPYFAKPDQLTGSLKDDITSLNVGDVYGPYEDNGNYLVAKITGIEVIPDSAEVSWMLRNVTPTDPSSAARERALLDSLKTLISSGNDTFDNLARDNSQDPGSASNGGDIGKVAYGSYSEALNNAIFMGSENGGLYNVSTPTGEFLVQVRNRIFENREPKYRVAYIRSAIVPSQETQDNIFDQVDEVVSNNKTVASLESALEAIPNVTLEKATPLSKNDYIFATLGGGETSREIIRWAFDNDTEKGQVSPSIYTYQDPVNYYNSKYVLAGLSEVNAPGLVKASDASEVVRAAVMNEKKGAKIAGQISGSDLSALATQFGSTLETVDNVSLSSSSVTGLGNEPKVLAAAFANAVNGVSAPVVGNNGVYIVKTTAKTEGTVPSNLIVQQQTQNQANRSRVNFGLLNALKKQFKPEDNRFTFF